LHKASNLEKAGEHFRSVLGEEQIRSIVALLPDDWLNSGVYPETPDVVRNIYAEFLITRMNNADIFENEARNARNALI